MSTNTAAVIYCRMSTKEQADSPAQQEAACRVKAAALKLSVSEVFVDAGISGSRNDRPEYLAMLEAAKAKEFDTLLIWKQNRLGRDQPEVELAIRELERLGVRIVACDGYDTNGGQSEKNRKLLRGVIGLVDQNYIDNLGEDVHRGQVDKVGKQRGFWMGSRPYGYDLVEVTSETELNQYGKPKRLGTTLKIDPEQAKAIVQIFEMYASGVSPAAIAADLNRRGVLSPTGGRWFSTTISSNVGRGLGIINNRLYTAEYTWNRSRWVKDGKGVPKRLDWPKNEWLTQIRPEWEIITSALWKRVRARQVQRARGSGPAISAGKAKSKALRERGGRDPRYVLGGILKCECGAHWQADSRYDYICPNHAAGACSNNLRVRRDAVHAAIYEHLTEHPFGPAAIKAATRTLEQGLKELEREQAEAARTPALARALTKLDEHVKAVKALDLPAAATNSALAELEAAREALSKGTTMGAVQREQRVQQLIDRLPAMVAEYRKVIAKGLKALSDPIAVAQAREALKTLIVGGEIMLKPNAEHTAAVGQLHLVDLREHALALAGFTRKCKMHGTVVASHQ